MRFCRSRRRANRLRSGLCRTVRSGVIVQNARSPDRDFRQTNTTREASRRRSACGVIRLRAVCGPQLPFPVARRPARRRGRSRWRRSSSAGTCWSRPARCCWLTVFGALQYLGTLIAPMFGVAGDRLGHRNLLFAMRVSYALLAARPDGAGVRRRGHAAAGARHCDAGGPRAPVGHRRARRAGRRDDADRTADRRDEHRAHDQRLRARRWRARRRRRLRAVRHGPGLRDHHRASTWRVRC